MVGFVKGLWEIGDSRCSCELSYPRPFLYLATDVTAVHRKSMFYHIFSIDCSGTRAYMPMREKPDELY